MMIIGVELNIISSIKLYHRIKLNVVQLVVDGEIHLTCIGIGTKVSYRHTL